jgi:hypothetical protein
MKKLFAALVVVLAFTATALPNPAWDLGLPSGTLVNFEGHGAFDQNPLPTVTAGVPDPLAVGTELFGIGKIDDVRRVSDLSLLFTPAAGKEMTESFWNAIVATSVQTFSTRNIGTTKHPIIDVVDTITSTFNDGARLVLVQDDTADYNPTGGPTLFNQATGNYPTVYTHGVDPGEEVFLDLVLNGGYSTISFSAHKGFLSGSFDSNDVVLIGGVGAPQFASVAKGHGEVISLNFGRNWLYNANTNVLATTVPAPAALISLFSGLALLGGYRLRRKS